MEEPSPNQPSVTDQNVEQRISEQQSSGSREPQLENEKLQGVVAADSSGPTVEEGFTKSPCTDFVMKELIAEKDAIICDNKVCIQNQKAIESIPYAKASVEACQRTADVGESMVGDGNEDELVTTEGTDAGDVVCLRPSQKPYECDPTLQRDNAPSDSKNECDRIEHNESAKKELSVEEVKTEEVVVSIEDSNSCRLSVDLHVVDSKSDVESDLDSPVVDCLLLPGTVPSPPQALQPPRPLTNVDSHSKGSHSPQSESENPPGGVTHDVHVDIINGPIMTSNTSSPSQLHKSGDPEAAMGDAESVSPEDETVSNGDRSRSGSPILESLGESEDLDPDLLNVMPQQGAGDSDDDHEVTPLYEVGPSVNAECEICLEQKTLHLRLCCGTPICDTCMTTYLEGVIRTGKVKIFCPGFCQEKYIHREEIVGRISMEMKEKFSKFLVDANNEPHIKTCPRCSHVVRVELAQIRNPRVKKKGYHVICPLCQLRWCFPCQSPWHEGITCKDFRKGDKLLRKWAKEKFMGQINAQKCPKCEVFIQRITGCDHMTCSKCNVSFCYRCGERYLHLKYVGDHYSRFSILGCKYIYKPDNAHQRRLVRGSIFGAKLMAAPLLGVLALGAGAVLLCGAVVFFIPCYGIKKLLKRRQEAQRRRYMAEERRRREEKIKEIRSRGDPYLEQFYRMRQLGISPRRLVEVSTVTAQTRGPGYISDEGFEAARITMRYNIDRRRLDYLL